MKVWFAGMVLIWLGLFASAAQSPAARLPVPPEQHQPWQPDAGIPTNILSATTTLFDQGFPDPRGCEYREIEVETGNMPNRTAGRVNTHGWLLPTAPDETNRFAICWNGIIYPVINVSNAVDLHAEVTNCNPRSDNRNWNGRTTSDESRSISYQSAPFTRILLLLRCGETSAATNFSPFERMFFDGSGNYPFSSRVMAATANGNQPQKSDPYLKFATDWTKSMFDRMVLAHLRGDEGNALWLARQLAEIQPKVEQEAANRGFQYPPNYYHAPAGREETRVYLDFLGQLPALLADLERRAQEGPRPGLAGRNWQAITNETERIEAMIRDLDLVQSPSQPWQEPVQIIPNADPVAALVHEGDAAVEPLMHCLESDKRLTRCVEPNLTFPQGWCVGSVTTKAMSAIQGILHADFPGGLPELRAYWNRYKGMPLADRFYAMLNDDTACNRWLSVAAQIAATNPPTSGGHLPMDLKGLRTKNNPSVAELMVRRALEVPADHPESYDLAAACQMAAYLEAWDAPAAKPVAEKLIQRCHTVMQYSSQPLGLWIAKLSLILARTGAPHPFDDYVAWLKTVTPKELDNSLLAALEPVEQYPDDTTLRRATTGLFTDTNSDWGHLPWPNQYSPDLNPAEPKLIKIPAYRLLLVHELERMDVCGSISWRSPDWMNYQMNNHRSGGMMIHLPANEPPANGTKMQLRWCDWLALSLSLEKGTSTFSPFGTEADRNAAIQVLKDRLLPR